MDVAVDPARGDDQVLTGNHLRGCSHDQFRVDTFHRVWISRLAHLDDAPVADTNVGLHDAPVINDQSVGDYQVERASLPRSACALAHAIANHLAAAECDLVAVRSEVFLHFDNQFRLGKADAITLGGAVKIRVCSSGDGEAHLFPLPL